MDRAAKLIVWTLPLYFVLTNMFRFGIIDLFYFAMFASACVYLTVRHFQRLKGR